MKPSFKRISIALACLSISTYGYTQTDSHKNTNDTIIYQPKVKSTSTNGASTSQAKHCQQNSPFGPYAMNYLLPYHYTASPAPNDTIIPGVKNDKEEVKFQLSVQSTLWRNLFHMPINLAFFYTQVSYWQFYAKSAYFRETNYNPGLFLHLHSGARKLPLKLHGIDLGLMHQSNGRGGSNERSWNRAYMNFQFLLNKHWSLAIEPWVRLPGLLGSFVYNPDISRYLGDGDIRLFYNYNNIQISLMLRNTIASHFARGAEELNCSFPLFNHLHGFVQLFSGYGQNLISYNHYTNAFGIGVSLFNRHSSQFH